MPTFPPLSQGLLPYWIMVAVSSSMYNTIQNFTVTWQTKEIYSKKENEGELDGFAVSLSFYASTSAESRSSYSPRMPTIRYMDVLLWYCTRIRRISPLGPSVSGRPAAADRRSSNVSSPMTVLMSDPQLRMYNLAALAFATAGLHFLSEFLVFRTIKLNRASIGPMIVPSERESSKAPHQPDTLISALTLAWMYAQKDYYLGL